MQSPFLVNETAWEKITVRNETPIVAPVFVERHC
jgi:hypothetical protein